MLDIMEWLLQNLQLPYVRLDGNTAVPDRLATVDTCAPLRKAPGSGAALRAAPAPLRRRMERGPAAHAGAEAVGAKTPGCMDAVALSSHQHLLGYSGFGLGQVLLAGSIPWCGCIRQLLLQD